MGGGGGGEEWIRRAGEERSRSGIARWRELGKYE